MFCGLSLLVIFFVHMADRQVFENRRTFDALKLDISQHAKSKGKMINWNIVIHSTMEMFNQEHKHLFNL